MKIHLVSDLHIEFGDMTLDGNADMLIIAGDMLEARSLRRNDGGLVRRMAADCLRFMTQEIAKYPLAVYVPGNHEYYGRTIEAAEEMLAEHLPGNCKLLQNSSLTIGGYLLFGGTLWTDMNKDDPATHEGLKRGMNDFRIIEDFTTHVARKKHRETLVQLSLELILDLPMIVVTHHAPSFRSVPPKYVGADIMNGGYASNLEALIESQPNIKLWCHGHMHSDSDYMIGETRVVCHPRGYYGYEEIANNYKPLEIELP